MRSMTGFGRAEVKTPLGKLVLELQSVNRKYLETSIFLPKELSSFEILVKKALGKLLFRGQVSARFSLLPDPKSVKTLLPDLNFLKKFKASWVEGAQKLGFSKEEIDLDFLLHQMELLNLSSQNDVKEMEKPLLDCLQKGLNALIKMKKVEGEQLRKDMEKRLATIQKNLSAIEKKAPVAKNRYRKKLRDKVADFSHLVDQDERLLREVAIYAEKIDIMEEITRFYSHIKQLSAALKTREETIGKKLDFIIQEMIRESNTIAAKSSETEVSKAVVEIKSELERIREQVQNIE